METDAAAVQAYVSTFSSEACARLAELRRIVGDVAPSATEAISYKVLLFRYHAQQLIFFAPWKDHIALYGPAIGAHREELAAYHTSKGTVHFPLDQPLPEALIKKLVSTRVAAIDTKAAAAPRKGK